MKRKFILFLSILLLGTSVPVEAAENNTAMATEAQEAPVIYGEMKDGLFVRTFDEEVAMIPYEQGTEEYAKEYFAIRDARKLEALTPEMEAADFVLIDGQAYPPNEGEQSAEESMKEQTAKYDAGLEPEYDEEGNVIPKRRHGTVTFTAQVDSDIKETCFVAITGVDLSRYYEFELFEINGYATTVQIPAGTYRIEGGGLSNDFTSAYPLAVENEEFTLQEGDSIIIPLTIGDVTEKLQPSETVEESVEETKANAEELPKEDASGTIKGLVVSLAVLAIAGFGIFVYTKAKKKES